MAKKKETTKQIQEKLVDNMKKWQKIENASVASTGNIIAETDNPLIRLVMEVIQRDSQLHYRVQQLIIDSIEKKALNIDYRQLGRVWKDVEEHIKLEKKTIQLAQQALKALEGTKNPIQIYFLEYLKADEEKHDALLEKLNAIKLKMYP